VSPDPTARFAATGIAASALALVVPFWNYLHFHRYSPVGSDALAVAGALALAGALIGAVVVRTHAAVARALLTATLLFVSADLFADIGGYHLVVFGVLLVATWLLRVHVLGIVLAVLVAVLLSTIVAGGREAPAVQRANGQPRRGTRPPLLHLIADEHIGVEGIPAAIPGGVEAKAALTAFYVEHGFRLYTRAYSRYHLTADAIPNALNLSQRDTGGAWLGPGKVTFPAPLTKNAYFDRLSAAGFDVRSYQPGFLDYCGTKGVAPVACFMVPANSVGNLPALSLAWTARTRLLVQHWLANNSSLYALANAFYNERLRPALIARHPPAPDWARTTYPLGPAGGLRILQTIARDIDTLPDLRGTAFFGHVLLPHAPYMLDAGCLVTSMLFDQPSQRELRQLHVSAQRRALYQRYWPQLRCLTARVGALVGQLEARGARDAVVIVHGDHGARIGAPIPPVGQAFTREDFDDFYSTLFAVRAPGIVPGLDSSVVSVGELLAGLAAGDFSQVKVEPDPAPFVFRTGDEDSPRRVRAPIPPR
jgi:hypothetical protein